MRTLLAASAPDEDGAGGSGKPPRANSNSLETRLPRKNNPVQPGPQLPPELVCEHHLIAGVLKEPKSLEKVRALLGDGDKHFWARATGEIWRQIIRMVDANEQVTVTRLKQNIESLDDIQVSWSLDDCLKVMESMNGKNIAGAVVRRANSMLQRPAAQETKTQGQQVAPHADREQQLQLAESQPVWVNMASVIAKPVTWLWPGKIAIGKLTVISGDPGLGKSMLSLDIVARVSRGAPWPDDSGVAPVGGGVLVSAEDDIEDTIRPRLDKALADVSRINAMQGVKFHDPESGKKLERSFCLQDLGPLEKLVAATPDCRVVVIDPVSAFTGSVDSHKNAEVRAMLTMLFQMASRLKVAVILVTHNNKGSGSAIYKVMGSIGFTAASRAVWGVYKDKEDPAKRLFLPIKNNVGADSEGLAYSINVVDEVGCVEWFAEPVKLTADELVAATTDEESGRGKRQEALSWLNELLSNGFVETKVIERTGKRAGFSMRTLERAKQDSKRRIVHRRVGFGPDSVCSWGLADSRSPDIASSNDVAAYGQSGSASGSGSNSDHRPPSSQGTPTSQSETPVLPEPDYTNEELERMADEAEGNSGSA